MLLVGMPCNQLSGIQNHRKGGHPTYLEQRCILRFCYYGEDQIGFTQLHIIAPWIRCGSAVVPLEPYQCCSVDALASLVSLVPFCSSVSRKKKPTVDNVWLNGCLPCYSMSKSWQLRSKASRLA